MNSVLVVAHEPDGGAGLIGARLEQRGFDIKTHVVAEHSSPNVAAQWPNFDDHDVVVLMGSVRSLTNKAEIDSWIFDELNLVRLAYQRRQPILGVCFGAQLLAEVLGGRVERAPVFEVGWHEIEAVDGSNHPAAPGPWMQWHHDRVILPKAVELLARNDKAVQMFKSHNALATQFHPEVDRDHVQAWLDQCEPAYLRRYQIDRRLLLADTQAHAERNRRQCDRFVDWFIDTIVMPARATARLAPAATSHRVSPKPPAIRDTLGNSEPVQSSALS